MARKCEEFTVGTCGNCGGQIIAAPKWRQVMGGWHEKGGPARCEDCGAQPMPLAMKERRKADRAAALNPAKPS